MYRRVNCTGSVVEYGMSPGGHCWDCSAGTLPSAEVTATHLKIGCSYISSAGIRSSNGLQIYDTGIIVSWWRHQMETFSALPAFCAGNSPVIGEFPAQRPVTRNFALICAWLNGWLNNRKAGDLRRHHAHCDVTVIHSNDQLCYLLSYVSKNTTIFPFIEREFVSYILNVFIMYKYMCIF